MDIWRLRRSGLGWPKTDASLCTEDAVEAVGEMLLSSTEGRFSAFFGLSAALAPPPGENFDLSLDDRVFSLLPSLAPLVPSSAAWGSMSSASMWQMWASEKERGLGCSTVDHLGVKVAVAAGGDTLSDAEAAEKKGD